MKVKDYIVSLLDSKIVDSGQVSNDKTITTIVKIEYDGMIYVGDATLKLDSDDKNMPALASHLAHNRSLIALVHNELKKFKEIKRWYRWKLNKKNEVIDETCMYLKKLYKGLWKENRELLKKL